MVFRYQHIHLKKQYFQLSNDHMRLQSKYSSY